MPSRSLVWAGTTWVRWNASIEAAAASSAARSSAGVAARAASSSSAGTVSEGGATPSKRSVSSSRAWSPCARTVARIERTASTTASSSPVLPAGRGSGAAAGSRPRRSSRSSTASRYRQPCGAPAAPFPAPDSRHGPIRRSVRRRRRALVGRHRPGEPRRGSPARPRRWTPPGPRWPPTTSSRWSAPCRLPPAAWPSRAGAAQMRARRPVTTTVGKRRPAPPKGRRRGDTGGGSRSSPGTRWREPGNREHSKNCCALGTHKAGISRGGPWDGRSRRVVDWHWRDTGRGAQLPVVHR